jgi:soluble lytic murein transglycosylase-like protein
MSPGGVGVGSGSGVTAKDTVVRARLRTLGAVITLVAVGLAVPASGAPGVRDGPEPDLASARGELDHARRSLTDLEVAVRRTNDEVAALDERLRTASTELARVRAQLADAEDAAAAASAVEREAAAALAAVDADLTTLSATWDDHRDRLQRRAVAAYKQGSVLPHDLLVRGIAGAGDWHEVTVTLETVGRLVRDDRSLADGTAELTRRTAALREEVGIARSHAVAATRTAAAERRRVEELAARHERAVQAVASERDRRAAVLAALEADTEARAVLVAQLERQVAELELAAFTVFVPIAIDLDVHGPPPAWASGLPPAGRPYAAAIEATAARYGLDGRLLAALVWTESGFRPDAVSHAGALGLAQLMPGTARGLRVDPRDPLQNLDGGARYLRTQLDRFGRVDLALAAYNAGPGRVEAAGGIPNIVETQLYVVRVLERYRALAGD